VGLTVSCDGAPVRAFLWENGSIVDLNTLIPAGSSLHLVWAPVINDRGEIAGAGVPRGVPPANFDAQGHAFVLIPCDDDHSDEEGCEAEDETATAEVQNSRAPIDQNRTNVTGGGLTPREIAARLRARGDRNRGFGAVPLK
jgi:probable HAF family extracellular repeat protein